MFDIVTLEKRIAALESNRGASLRFGIVTEVNAREGTVRVMLPDGEGLVSWPLQVLQERSYKDKKQCLPDINESVACLFAGQGLEAGVVLGACYSQKTPPPQQEAHIDFIRYEDGSELFYDRKKHQLAATINGSAHITTTGTINAKTKTEALVSASHITLTASESITLTANTINLRGNLTQHAVDGGAAISTLCGTFTVSQGDIIAEDISLCEHIHGGVKAGSSSTSQPKQG